MLNKAQYLEYKTCKRLNYLKRVEKQTEQLEEEQQEKLEELLKDKSYANELFKGGTTINSRETSGIAHLTTKKLIEEKSTIYRGALSWNDFNCRIDIMVPTGEGWNLYLVKLKNKINEDEYKNEIDFIGTIAGKNGIDIKSFNIIHLNKEYIRGESLNINELFLLKDVTHIWSGEALEDLEEFKELTNYEIPHAEMIKECLGCEKLGECFTNIPKLSVFDLSGVNFENKKCLYENNIITIEEFIDRCIDNKSSIFKPSPKVSKGIELYRLGEEYIDRGYVSKFLSSFKFPLYFLDFETFMNAIPSHEGMKPYQQITFQYSLHVLNYEGGELIHREYLGEEGTNPSRGLAESLCGDIGEVGSVVVYHQQFEKGRLKELSEMFPEFREKLLDISSRIVDLEKPFFDLKVFRESFRFKSSIKVILPALYPNNRDLDYHSLNIQNGVMAMNVFPRLHLKSMEERRKLREDLLAYCGLDTLAMVKIYEYLKGCM